MESAEFLIIGIGGFLAVMLLILITRRKTPKNERTKLSNEIEQLKKEVAARNANIQTNLQKISQLQLAEKERDSIIRQKDQIILNFNSTIAESKEKENKLNRIISENEAKIEQLNIDLKKLSAENLQLNNIIVNHKNNIPNILKIRKDNTDLFFFYRELIHTIVYYNPIHTRITSFQNEINDIDDNLKKKEFANKFGECLNELNFSDIEQQIQDFKETIVGVLYTPFHEIGEKVLGIHDVKQGEIFCEKTLHSIDEIFASRMSDIESIGDLYQILTSNYERWRKILSRSWLGQLFHDLWEELKVTMINQEYGLNLGDILRSWEESYNLSESDFVGLYNNTIQKFIEMSFFFTRNMDIDFTVIEMLYQEYQDIENSLLHKKIQTELTTGDDIMGIYSIWRETQSNSLLSETPFLVQHVFEELQTKKIDEKSINNIKEMVCPN